MHLLSIPFPSATTRKKKERKEKRGTNGLHSVLVEVIDDLPEFFGDTEDVFVVGVEGCVGSDGQRTAHKKLERRAETRWKIFPFDVHLKSHSINQ